MKTIQLILTFSLIYFLHVKYATAQEYESKELNGITMYYRINGEGEPLILLHGFTQTGNVWDSMIEDLSSKYRLIIPDLRGHGRSTNPTNEFTHRQSALDVFGLLDQLGIDTFKAMGISTGGMTLLHMATTQRERVEAMVLIGATSYFPEQARVILRASSPDSLSDTRLERIGSRHSGGAEQARSLMAQFSGFQDSYDDMNFTRPYLSTIKARTLIVHGDRDAFFPVSIPLEQYEAIPKSYLWIVPNGGHVPLIFSEISRDFFVHTVLTFLIGEWQ
ncbi:alpha/beta fold hydrolase [Bacteroidota bacterium]